MKLNIYIKQSLLVLFFVCASVIAHAQKNFFVKSAPTGKYKLESSLKSYVIYKLDQVAMKQYLAKAPLEFSTSSKPLSINVPLPDGTIETYQIFESPILSPEIAAQFPDIKTYTGKGKTNGTTIRISFTTNGFDALITGAGKDAVYFQKANTNAADNSFISYFGSKVTNPGKPNANSKCGTIGKVTTDITTFGDNKTVLGIQNLTSTGTTLRTFRLAVSATAEFTTLKGAGNATTAYASVVAFVNRLIAVYRSELSISFTLVSGTNLVLPQ